MKPIERLFPLDRSTSKVRTYRRDRPQRRGEWSFTNFTLAPNRLLIPHVDRRDSWQ